MKQINVYKLQMIKEQAVEYKALSNMDEVISVLKALEYEKNAEEVLSVLAVNAKGDLIGFYEVSRGDINSSVVAPREIFKRLVLCNAAGFFLVHNHPSGDSTPSPDDIRTTKRIDDAGELMGIKLLDHFVVGDEYVSMKNKGLM